uniref:ULP_PROTEASE domain-containing protein n=1 Tax=Steinernema glaseri TaxID=37863 RepID=A0A1I8AG78_9BILA
MAKKFLSARGFAALPEDASKIIQNAWSKGLPTEVLTTDCSAQLTRADLATLKDKKLVNDEIINIYLHMICDRSAANEDMLPKVYAYSTFFFPKLTKDGYESVKRWTRKVDIFSYNQILVPVFLRAHWTLVVIHMDQRIIEYYDSLGGKNNSGLEKLRQYLATEAKDKKQMEFYCNSIVMQVVINDTIRLVTTTVVQGPIFYDKGEKMFECNRSFRAFRGAQPLIGLLWSTLGRDTPHRPGFCWQFKTVSFIFYALITQLLVHNQGAAHRLSMSLRAEISLL